MSDLRPLWPSCLITSGPGRKHELQRQNTTQGDGAGLLRRWQRRHNASLGCSCQTMTQVWAAKALGSISYYIAGLSLGVAHLAQCGCRSCPFFARGSVSCSRDFALWPTHRNGFTPYLKFWITQALQLTSCYFVGYLDLISRTSDFVFIFNTIKWIVSHLKK